MKVVNPPRLRRARIRLGYTQKDLASLVGCKQQYVSALETGHDTDCSEVIALLICDRLNIELEDAFEVHENISIPKNTSSNVVKNKKLLKRCA